MGFYEFGFIIHLEVYKPIMKGKYMNMQIYIHRHDHKNPIFLLKFVKIVILFKNYKISEKIG
jgi:hypothetical protein